MSIRGSKSSGSAHWVQGLHNVSTASVYTYASLAWLFTLCLECSSIGVKCLLNPSTLGSSISRSCSPVGERWSARWTGGSVVVKTELWIADRSRAVSNDRRNQTSKRKDSEGEHGCSPAFSSTVCTCGPTQFGASGPAAARRHQVLPTPPPLSCLWAEPPAARCSGSLCVVVDFVSSTAGHRGWTQRQQNSPAP